MEIIFRFCITEGEFLSEWKKVNVVNIYKKNDKQYLKNYRPILLLPIFDEMFERIIYNNMVEYFTAHN